MTRRIMLDTNMVSHVIRQDGNALSNFLAADPRQLCISAISYGEITFGLAKRPQAVNLARLLHSLLIGIDILPWTRETADIYGSLRAGLERSGLSIGNLDLLIAAHAMQVGATLVTADRDFAVVDGLSVENWVL